MLAKSFWILALLVLALCHRGQAQPNTLHPSPVQPSQTSTLTLRLDYSNVPLDEEVVAFRVHVTDRQRLMRLIPEITQPRQRIGQDFLLSEIPVGAITVVLEGLNEKGDVVVFFVEDFDLTTEQSTETVSELIPRVESSEDLGFDFRRIMLAQPSASPFERVSHYSYLYHGNKEICNLGNCSVSPSGDYAVYQDGSSGKMFLYRRADGIKIQLTDHFVALAKGFTWDEDAGTVEVHFTTGLSESYSIRN